MVAHAEELPLSYHRQILDWYPAECERMITTMKQSLVQRDIDLDDIELDGIELDNIVVTESRLPGNVFRTGTTRGCSSVHSESAAASLGRRFALKNGF